MTDTIDVSRDEFEQLRETVEAQQQRIDTLEDELAEERARREELEAQVEQNTDRISYNFEDVCTVETRLDDIEGRIEDANPGGGGGETGLQETVGVDWTPIERNALMDHDELEEHCGPSDRRAVMIFKHWQEWSSKTPKGNLLKTGTDSLKSLLSAACDEHLAWRQVYRACRHVEKLSKGQITFFQHDTHGWMLKQHSAFASHQNSAGVTASSVGA